MNFLLDTDTCSFHMKSPGRLAYLFIQYASSLAIPTIVLAELHVGAHKHHQSVRLISLINDLRQEVIILDFVTACAERFGELRGSPLQHGLTPSRMDLLIASVALVHNLTLVTHNTADYQYIPGLRLDDWLIP